MKKYIVKNFVFTVICIGIAEYVISLLQNYAFRVFYDEILEGASNVDWNVGGVQLTGFIILMSLQMLAGALGWSIVADGISKLMVHAVPSFRELSQMAISREKMMLFLLLAVASMVLYIIPYVVGIFFFTKKVNQKIKEVEAEREKERQEYDRGRNLLLSDIAHDVRTPITTISGYSRAIRDGMVTDEEKKNEYLLAIQKKSERMEDLIKLLFEYVKLDSEGFGLDKEKVDICELLRENAALIYPDMEENQMEFEVDIPDEKVEVELDKLQISRVITNLLVNAIRHNKPGTRIGLLVIIRPGVIKIDVADNGDTIPEEIKEKIFEPFSKADKSRSNAAGSGLGLSIAKKVVDMHGWTLDINEQIDAYTKAFEIIISL